MNILQMTYNLHYVTSNSLIISQLAKKEQRRATLFFSNIDKILNCKTPPQKKPITFD